MAPEAVKEDGKGDDVRDETASFEVLEKSESVAAGVALDVVLEESIVSDDVGGDAEGGGESEDGACGGEIVLFEERGERRVDG